MATPLAYLPKLRSEKVCRSAHGMPCALRLPGVCNGNDETTVLAHVRGKGDGMGTKPCDLQSVYACQACHDVLDRRRPSPMPWADLGWEVVRAMGETHARLVEADLIQSPGAKIVS